MIDDKQIEKIRKNILGRIRQRQQLEAMFWLIFSGIMSVGSLFILVPAIQYTISEFYLSNFYQYLSLIFTDGAALLPYYQEFILSLTESLPLFGLTGLLIFTLILLSSARLAAKNIRFTLLSI